MKTNVVMKSEHIKQLKVNKQTNLLAQKLCRRIINDKDFTEAQIKRSELDLRCLKAELNTIENYLDFYEGS